MAALVGCEVGGEPETLAFCDDAEQFQDIEFDPGDPDAAREASERLAALADKGPAEIEGDIEMLSDSFGDLAQAFRSAEPSDETSLEAARNELFDEHSREELDEALDNVADFAQDECDIDIGNDAAFGELDQQLGTEGFCESAERFSEDIENLDPTDVVALEAAAERLGDLAQSAPEEIEEDVEVLDESFGAFARAFVAADPNDAEALLASVQQLFASHDGEALDRAVGRVGEFAEDDCGLVIESTGRSFSELESQLRSFGLPEAGPGEETVEPPEPAGDLPAPTEPPAAGDAELAPLVAGCHAGDMHACDDLFFESPIGSAEEDYGNTCGGREPSPRGQLCVDIFPG